MLDLNSGLDLRVVSSSPAVDSTLGVKPTLKKRLHRRLLTPYRGCLQAAAVGGGAARGARHRGLHVWLSVLPRHLTCGCGPLPFTSAAVWVCL